MTRFASIFCAMLAVAALAVSDQDNELIWRHEMWPDWELMYGLSQNRYVAQYGNGAAMQLSRTLLARAEQFVEPVQLTLHRAHGDLRNLPVFPTNTPPTLYRTWWAMRGEAPYTPGDLTRRVGQPSNNFETLKSQYEGWRGVKTFVAPTCSVMCAECDAQRNSYSLPPFGVVIFNDGDTAEEYAHFFNWSPPGVASTGFSAEPLNEITSWGEFKAAYRGLKLDAWRLGYDVGVQGGMDAYVMDLTGEVPRVSTNWLSVATNIVEVEVVDDTPVTNVIEWVTIAEVVTHNDLLTFTNRVPANAVKLLDAYIEARDAEGTQADNADKARVRLWMRSDKVGRMVL
jgi:hypothetical protein